MNNDTHNYVSISTLLVCVGLAALFGAAIKTYIDSCMYRIGVKHGFRVAKGDVDTELDEARDILHFQREEDFDEVSN
jgi:hypothetical protein